MQYINFGLELLGAYESMIAGLLGYFTNMLTENLGIIVGNFVG